MYDENTGRCGNEYLEASIVIEFPNARLENCADPLNDKSNRN